MGSVWGAGSASACSLGPMWTPPTAHCSSQSLQTPGPGFSFLPLNHRIPAGLVFTQGYRGDTKMWQKGNIRGKYLG